MSIFLTHCDHSLDCRKNVNPFEEMSLDDPGSSNGELAPWGCLSPSEEQAGRASFIPVSTKVTSQPMTLRCFIVAKMACPHLHTYVQCYRVGCV